jgi:hypothetical protein
LERLLPSPPAFHIAARLIEDTSKAAAWDSAWDWARLKGEFSMPTMVGTATADTPATARNAFFAKLSLIPVRFAIISSILFLRFAPVTPDTQGRRDSTESRHTYCENAFRVNPWLVAQKEHFFITGDFPLLYHPLSDPPHQRMKPEDCFHEHMNRGDQIVPVVNMTEFMCDDAFQLGWSQPVENPFWQQHDRPEHTEDTWLQQHWRGHCPDGQVQI